MIIEEVEKVKEVKTSADGQTKIIVLNDNHNTFDYVATSLTTVLPGVSLDDGYYFADLIDSAGLAIVWTGFKEIAELYHAQLVDRGLTLAPLEN